MMGGCPRSLWSLASFATLFTIVSFGSSVAIAQEEQPSPLIRHGIHLGLYGGGGPWWSSSDRGEPNSLGSRVEFRRSVGSPKGYMLGAIYGSLKTEFTDSRVIQKQYEHDTQYLMLTSGYFWIWGGEVEFSVITGVGRGSFSLYDLPGRSAPASLSSIVAQVELRGTLPLTKSGNIVGGFLFGLFHQFAGQFDYDGRQFGGNEIYNKDYLAIVVGYEW